MLRYTHFVKISYVYTMYLSHIHSHSSLSSTHIFPICLPPHSMSFFT